MSHALGHDFSLNREQGTSKFVANGHEKMPVYIMSPMQRCGTNHLADVVMLHPDFQLPKVLNEDFVLEHANLLSEYCERTHHRWKNLNWIEDPDECRRQLELHLGQAILSLLGNQIDENKRLLLKTPDCNNIDKFFQFFPRSEAIALDERRSGCSGVGYPEMAESIRRVLDAPVGQWMSAHS